MQQHRRMEPPTREENTPSLNGGTAQHAEEGRVNTHVQTENYLASVLVPRTTSTRDITALETAMQGLAPDDRHPVALELTATATSRHFLLRATSAMSLRHLADQVQARYPQAIIRPVDESDDPLSLQKGEDVSAVELCAGAATYLPLHAWRERQLLQEGADPLLGILGVFNHLPPNMRVAAQLCAPPGTPDVVTSLSPQVGRTSPRAGTPAGEARRKRGAGKWPQHVPTGRSWHPGRAAACLVALPAPTQCTDSTLAGAGGPLTATRQVAGSLPRPFGCPGRGRHSGACGSVPPRVRRIANQEPHRDYVPVRYAPGGREDGSPGLSRASAPLRILH